MKRSLAVITLLALVPLGIVADPRVGVAGAEAPAPRHTLSVEGDGVSMSPAFDAGTERYAVGTSAATTSITVRAATTADGGRVLVNGSRLRDGARTLTGLTAGDEISVIFDDGDGEREVHALFVLPADFPDLTVVRTSRTVTPGLTFLTLTQFAATGDTFQTVVDRNGVPIYVHQVAGAMGNLDFKPAPNGHYSVFRRGPGDDRRGAPLVELDEQFRPVGESRTVGLLNTDEHDAIVRPDGSRFLISYEPNAATGLVDSVIQEIDAAGNLVYSWNTADHVNPAAVTTAPSVNPDYAHINSIQVMDDGDILASFRHFSSVYKIAWSDRPGVARGDIVWRLGGRDSDFTFPDDPLGGPCAQHTASQLADGRILMFDNGGATRGTNPSLCVDPADRATGRAERPLTRVAEYVLDEQAREARLAWSYTDGDRFALFAGSARRLDDGHTLIGWASERRALATELDGAGTPIWELAASDNFATYRAVRAPAPDAIAPRITISGFPDGTVLRQGERRRLQVECTDRGGSSLSRCDYRSPLDTTTVGFHEVTVTARDEAGNVTATKRRYEVGAAPTPGPTPPSGQVDPQPDLMLGGLKGGEIGAGVYAEAGQQRGLALLEAGKRYVVRLRLQNDGNSTERLRLLAVPTRGGVVSTYTTGGRDITDAVRLDGGGWLTPRLRPGRSIRVTVVLTRTVRDADPQYLRIALRSTARPAVLDRGGYRVTTP